MNERLQRLRRLAYSEELSATVLQAIVLLLKAAMFSK